MQTFSPHESDYPWVDPEEEDRDSGPNGKLQVAIGLLKILVRTPTPQKGFNCLSRAIHSTALFEIDKNTFANIENRGEMQLRQKRSTERNKYNYLK